MMSVERKEKLQISDDAITGHRWRIEMRKVDPGRRRGGKSGSLLHLMVLSQTLHLGIWYISIITTQKSISTLFSKSDHCSLMTRYEYSKMYTINVECTRCWQPVANECCRPTVTRLLRFKSYFVPRLSHVTSFAFKSLLFENQADFFKCKHKILFLYNCRSDPNYV